MKDRKEEAVGRRRTEGLAVLAFILAALLALAGPAARAQRLPGHASPPETAERSAPAESLRLAAALAAAPNQVLVPARIGAGDQIAALTAWNAAGKLPYRVGFTRALPNSERVDLAAAPAAVTGDARGAGDARVTGDAGDARVTGDARGARVTGDARGARGARGDAAAGPRPYAGGLLGDASGGQLTWGIHIRVQEAYRLRLHLENVRLPAGAVLLVASAGGGAPRAFGRELISPTGSLWTPSVAGESLYLEVHVPAGAAPASFSLREVLELFDSRPAPVAGAAGGTGLTPKAEDTSCLVDSSCITETQFPGITDFRHGIADLVFVVDGTALLCSGGLLANAFDNSTPYLLTANHCFSTQEAASSLEATFDFYTESCNGSVGNSLPTVDGAVLLATKAAGSPDFSSDFTLVQLAAVPPGRWYFGWDADAADLVQGLQLDRLSHPAPSGEPLPQTFSRSSLDTGDDIPLCSNAPRPQFIYATVNQGGTFGGSSGAPLLLANGDVVGQLGGGCAFQGHDPSDGCDYDNSEVDGAFSITYPFVRQWLSPTLAPTTPCTTSATTLCIDNNPGDRRFAVAATYQTAQDGGLSGAANAIPLTPEGITQGGILWFFSPTNPELLVKVINACSVTSTFWVFYSATTNVGLALTVTDTRTGHFKTYLNPDLTTAQPVQDTSAFTCP